MDNETTRLSVMTDRASRPVQMLENLFRVERYRLQRYFRRRLGDDAASDLVQEAFMRAMGMPAHIDNPTAYVWRIAHNLLAEHGRRRKRQLPCFSLDDGQDPGTPPEQEWRIDSDDLLNLWFAGLSLKTREVLLLHRVEGFSYREISVRLGISTHTVDYHMVRALAVCRRAAAALQSHEPERFPPRSKRRPPGMIRASCCTGSAR